MTDFTVNGTEVDSVNFNGTDCDNVYFNGVKVWTKGAILVAGRFFEQIFIPPDIDINFTYVGFSQEYSVPIPPLHAAGTLTPNPLPGFPQVSSPANLVYSLLTEQVLFSANISYKLIVRGGDVGAAVVSITGVFSGGGSERTIELNIDAQATGDDLTASWTITGFSSDDQMVLGNSYLVSVA